MGAACSNTALGVFRGAGGNLVVCVSWLLRWHQMDGWQVGFGVETYKRSLFQRICGPTVSTR